jgi:hypothetical protein
MKRKGSIQMQVEVYEVGDKLLYVDTITGDPSNDLPMDAVERQAVVTAVDDDDDTVYVTYGDGVSDWLHTAQVLDLFERVPWDSETA